MVSVIIASVNPEMLRQVKENIAQTIGVTYEVMAFDNRDGKKGICEIYNEGIAKAQYGVLCFMHEDVAFKTQGWGKTVRDVFDQNSRLGIIGIAGTTYKSLMPIGWPNQATQTSERSNLIQSFKYLQLDTHRACFNPLNEKLAKVVVVDGAWMCVKKEVTNGFHFDDKTFKKFHCYDLDYCLSAGKMYDVAVTYEVLLHHFSDGNLNREWMEQQLLFYGKWEQELPMSTEAISKKQVMKFEKQNFRYWVKLIRDLGFERTVAYHFLHRPKQYKVLGLKYFLKLHYSIWVLYRSKK